MRIKDIEIKSAFEEWLANFLRENGYETYCAHARINNDPPFDIHAVRPDRVLYLECVVWSSNLSWGSLWIPANKWREYSELNRISKERRKHNEKSTEIEVGFAIVDTRKCTNPFDFAIERVLFEPFHLMEELAKNEKMRSFDEEEWTFEDDMYPVDILWYGRHFI